MSRTKRTIPHKGFLRHPKTKQELAQNEAATLEGVPVRPVRQNIPTAWSDKPISARNEQKTK